MKTKKELQPIQLPHAFDLSEEKLESLSLLFQKDYTTDAFSFIQNHHRIINYWGDGVNLLPPAYEEGKRRRFSFFDLIWLGIVRELREFGMEKEKIAVLKEELLNPPPHSDLIKMYRTHQKEMEALFKKSSGISTEELRGVMEIYMTRQSDIQRLAHSLLCVYLVYTLGFGTDVRILVSKTGTHLPFYEGAGGDISFMKENNTVYQSSHLSISLRDVISFFAAMPYVKDEVKQHVLSETEWQLIEIIRDRKPREVKVKFNSEEQMTLVEVTKRKKVSVEARLTEILVKGAYETIEVVTQDGRVEYVESRERIKL